VKLYGRGYKFMEACVASFEDSEECPTPFEEALSQGFINGSPCVGYDQRRTPKEDGILNVVCVVKLANYYQ
jgi:hypothetical protein